jgi:hypothetical protein
MYDLDLPKQLPRMCRTYKQANWQKYGNIIEKELKGVSFDQDEWSNSKLETAVSLFYSAINLALNHCCPQKAQKQKNTLSWWDESCERNRRIARTVERKAFIDNKKPTQTKWDILKNRRRKLKQTICKARRDGWQRLVSETASSPDMAKLYKIFDSKSQLGSIGLLRRQDGSVCKNTKEALGILMQEHFPDCEVDKYAEASICSESHNIDTHDLTWINKHRLIEAIKPFGPNKASGPDDIKPIAIQNLPEVAIWALCSLLRASMGLG